MIDRKTGKTREMLHDFKAPHDAVRLGDGSILVNELGSKSLVRASGEHGKDRTAVIGGLEGPVGLAAGPGGTVYVTEAFAGQVSKVESNGEKTVIAKDLKMPEGIALAPDGKLIVAEVGAKRIVSIDPANGDRHRDRRQPADRTAGRARRTAEQHSDRRRRRRDGDDLLLVGYRERDLQGDEEIDDVEDRTLLTGCQSLATPRPQFSLRFGTGVSNCAISAVCGALPLKVSTLPSLEITTRSPSAISPARIISASGSCTLRWITRFSGPRAVGGIPALGRQPVARRRIERQRDLAILQQLLQPRELDLDDPAHLALLQAVEQDDLVDAVEEFGPEMRPHHPHHLLAHR